MDATTSLDSLDVTVDMLGQLPLMRIYTQICFCFSHPDSVADDSIVDTLTSGLERLSASFPWVAGQVVNEGAANGDTGIFKIKALNRIPRLVVKDLRNDPSAPTMDGLKRAEFPMSMLDEDVISPRRTLPGGPGYSPTDPEPVLILQANFIVGGFILTINGQHATMDMTGQGEVIRLLSKACHGEQFTPAEVSTGNLARDNIVPLLDDLDDTNSGLDNQIVQPPSPAASESDSQPPPALPSSSWANLSFSAESLANLKSAAMKSIGPGSGFVSTDDALSAFIWQSVGRARLPRLSPGTESTLSRAVDMRHILGVPKTYPGILQNMAYSKCTLQQLVEEPLGAEAARLRSQLVPEDLRHNTRALITLLSRTPDKSAVSITAKSNPSTDCLLSSWVKVDCYGLDFNLGLGSPESVRRPRFTPFESLMYLCPKAPDGEITAAVSLRDEDMERLKKDDEFRRYGRFIG